MTVFFGILIALEKGFSSLILETDASTVVKLINKGIQPLSEIEHVIRDISDCLSRFHSPVSVVFAPPSANLVAHSLVRLVFQGFSQTIWIDDYPLCVQKHIADDSNFVSPGL
ncbi:hypothetical protein ACOSP7_010175 [Xanthoceras sorbifolium]